MIESVLEYLLRYEQICQFDAIAGFLGLSEDSFDEFRANYRVEAEYLTGDQPVADLQTIRRLAQAQRLSDVFDLELTREAKKKLKHEQNEESGNSRFCPGKFAKNEDLDFLEFQNSEPAPKKKRSLKSEVIQWKSKQCTLFLTTKIGIIRRLEKQLHATSQLLETLSKHILQLSYLFREMDIQETSLNFKMKHGLTWMKELKRFKQACQEGRESAQPNAWRFGLQMCNRWSVTQKLQSLLLKGFKAPCDVITSGAESLIQRVFDPQNELNGEYVYEQRKLRERKQKLLRGTKVAKWGLTEKFQNNKKVTNWLKSGEAWARGLMLWKESSAMRHFRGVFEAENSASFLQLENFQMFENSFFYRKFLELKALLNKHDSIISEY